MPLYNPQPTVISDHGGLSGLGDDDHTQYHNDARGDARYYGKAAVDAAIAAVQTDIDDHEADTANPHSVTKAQVGLGNADNTSDATKQAAFLLAAFPVGSIYITTSSTNPGTFLGGTWAAFGAGRVPVGFDSGQTEFDTDEETGGAKTHTLTTAEMPSHTHTQDSHNHTQDAHGHTYLYRTMTTSQAHSHTETGRISAGSTTSPTGGGTSAAGIIDNTTATNQATTATNQNTGGGGAHNNLQPYIVVRMWKRTA